MRFNVLGRVEVLDNDRVADLGGPKQRAVLALLALRAGSVVSLDRLVDQLWGDEPPARAVGSLQAYVSNLRRALEPYRPPRAPARVLVSRPPGYLLSVDHEAVDALRFEALVADGDRLLVAARPAAARTTFEAALELWRGDGLAHLATEGVAVAEATRLDELRWVAVEGRLTALVDLGRHDLAAAELEHQVHEAPFRERLWELLVVARYRAGRQADALRATARPVPSSPRSWASRRGGGGDGRCARGELAEARRLADAVGTAGLRSRIADTEAALDLAVPRVAARGAEVRAGQDPATASS